MEDSMRTLVIVLTMHRCGSSLTTNILQRLGLSLGTFELFPAASSNPHGHFEAVPFLYLARDLQGLAFGFKDDVPESPQVHSRYCATQGEWPEDVEIPRDLLDRGRSLIRALVDSGEVSGFKDPRTILLWPYWKRVLEDFPGLRVVPVSLVRSPHEIAMSLVKRRDGSCGYWAALDVIAVHLRRQKAILEGWDIPVPSLCFGSPSYLSTLETVARHCGLAWDSSVALEVFDGSCVHHTPAIVPHIAQSHFDSLTGAVRKSGDLQANQAQLEKDARVLEALRLRKWQQAQDELAEAREQSRRAQVRADEAEGRVRGVQAQLDVADARTVAIERERDQARAGLDRLVAEVLQASTRLQELQTRLDESRDRELQSRDRELQARDRELQARDRELQEWQRNEALRDRLVRFESHPILGTALRGRRQLRRVIRALGPSSAAG